MSERLRRTVAGALYAIAGLISIVLGCVYILRGAFMPYHEVALGHPWPSLEAELQTLLLALMDVAGGGWAVTGALVILLVLIPFRRGEHWARWAIPAALAALYIPILLATLAVLFNTPATPPWYGNAGILLLTAVSLALDRPWRDGKK